ncbi:MAG: hypothetical protein M1374_05475 [Firmicutes bacterium]|nr:hypothetical protein [Bacillota bacterium]
MAENLPFEIEESHAIEEDISRLLSRKFTVVRKGYPVEDVREFIFDVEIHFRKMLRREAELHIRLAEEIKRAEAPELDEETLSRAIGMESGKVLRAAHEAAKDILAQSQLRAEEILQEASAVMEKNSSSAQESANNIIAEARLAAEIELETTKERCIAMIEEAKASRRQILNDLLERRKSLSGQVRQLQAAVDTFQVIFDNAERAVREVSTSLSDAEKSAKVAGDAAAEDIDLKEDNFDFLNSDSVASLGGYSLSGNDKDSNNGYAYGISDFSIDTLTIKDSLATETTVGTPVESIKYPQFGENHTDIPNTDRDSEVILVSDGLLPAEQDSTETGFAKEMHVESNYVDLEVSKDLEVANSVNPEFQPVEAEVDEDDSAGDGIMSYGSWNNTEVDSGFRILGSVSTSFKPASYTEDQNASTSLVRDLGKSAADDSIAVADQAKDSVGMSEAGAVFIQTGNSALRSDPSGMTVDENDSVALDYVKKDYREEANSNIDHTDSSLIKEQGGITTSSIFDAKSSEELSVAYFDKDSRLGLTGDDSASTKDDIDTIFAQIRADRDREVQQARSLLEGNSTYTDKTHFDNIPDVKFLSNTATYATGSVDTATDLSVYEDVMNVGSENNDIVTNVVVSGMENQDDHDELHILLADSEEYLLRKMKKLIRQHQNIVLDDLRLNWNKESYDYIKTNYLDACAQDIEEAQVHLEKLYADVRSFVTTKSLDVYENVSVHFAEEANSLILYTLKPVEKILQEISFRNDNTLQDEQDFMEHLSSVYRELKGDRLGRGVGDCVVKIVSGATYDEALANGSRLRWIMDGEICPDCEDNSLLVVLAGSQFPTGHLMPPAHPGCRCVIRAVEEKFN